MDEDLRREDAILTITEMLRENPFSLEIKVVKRPRGVKIIYEVTKEDMDKILTWTIYQ